MIGIENRGNSCFLSSSLQALAASTSVQAWILRNHEVSRQQSDSKEQVQRLNEEELLASSLLVKALWLLRHCTDHVQLPAPRRRGGSQFLDLLGNYFPDLVPPVHQARRLRYRLRVPEVDSFSESSQHNSENHTSTSITETESDTSRCDCISDTSTPPRPMSYSQPKTTSSWWNWFPSKQNELGHSIPLRHSSKNTEPIETREAYERRHLRYNGKIPDLKNYVILTQPPSVLLEDRRQCDSSRFPPGCLTTGLQRWISPDLESCLALLLSTMPICKRPPITKDGVRSQEDVHEFIMETFRLLEDAFPATQKSIIPPFLGKLETTICCSVCGSSTTNCEVMSTLELDIHRSESVSHALRKFFHPEVLSGSNAYHCSRCQRQTIARRTTQIRSLPALLCVQLKRFAYSHRLRQPVKLKHVVDFPVILDTKIFSNPAVIPEAERGIYKLVSVIVHLGMRMDSGHYVSMVRDVVDGEEVWVDANDDILRRITLAEVCDEQAYILFYERVVSRRDLATMEMKEAP